MAHIHEEKQHERAASRLRPGPALVGHTIHSSEEQHAWIIDQVLIPCSIPEYRCLKLLLEQEGRCVPFAHLSVCLPEVSLGEQTNKQERMRIAHVMSVLRAKIWASDLDIVSVMNIGYLLLSCESEEAVPARTASLS